ncbi:hypothetical protein [Barnesiella sp. An55]|uniref:hypothetical protein n=1 Tax=Barnesiella sp. An55 TaxID=1965646 RepID=UPI001178B5B0|nr:hypothetical protein [Barnesiella sp. An55]HIZ25526.1 hypothetical protein [Candidatus Barnesiella merdipullorum]
MKVESRKTSLLDFYTETHPILSKDSESRKQRQTEKLVFQVWLYRAASFLLERYERESAEANRGTESFQGWDMQVVWLCDKKSKKRLLKSHVDAAVPVSLRYFIILNRKINLGKLSICLVQALLYDV